MFILVDQLHGKILENIDINIRNPFISHVDKQFQREYGDAKKKNFSNTPSLKLFI